MHSIHSKATTSSQATNLLSDNLIFDDIFDRTKETHGYVTTNAQAYMRLPTKGIDNSEMHRKQLEHHRKRQQPSTILPQCAVLETVSGGLIGAMATRATNPTRWRNLIDLASRHLRQP
jgi:hypothetical protein